MNSVPFPVIDPVATGENILRLRRERGLTVRDLQAYFSFEEPQAIYKWQRGKSLPSVDNLYALGALLKVPIEEILVPKLYSISSGQQAEACCPPYFRKRSHQRPGMRRNTGAAQTILQRLKSLFCQGQPGFSTPRLSEGWSKDQGWRCQFERGAEDSSVKRIHGFAQRAAGNDACSVSLPSGISHCSAIPLNCAAP